MEAKVWVCARGRTRVPELGLLNSRGRTAASGPDFGGRHIGLSSGALAGRGAGLLGLGLGHSGFGSTTQGEVILDTFLLAILWKNYLLWARKGAGESGWGEVHSRNQKYLA